MSIYKIVHIQCRHTVYHRKATYQGLEHNEGMIVVVCVNFLTSLAQVHRAIRAAEPEATEPSHAPITQRCRMLQILQVP